MGPELRFFGACDAHSDIAVLLTRGLLNRAMHDIADLNWSVLAGAEMPSPKI
jgi:hypothetical protein